MARTARLASSRGASETDVFGPRLPRGGLGPAGMVATYTLERGTRQTWQIQVQ